MRWVGHDAARDLLLLSLTAGSADAAGYLGLGRVFTSNMTGNLVLLGIHLGEGRIEDAIRVIFVLAIYIGGVYLGALLGRGIEPKDWPTLATRLIGLEKLALVIFGLGWLANGVVAAPHGGHFVSYGLMALLAFGMGLQSAAMNRLSAPGAATTAVTGTLTALAAGLAELLAGEAGAAPADRQARRQRIRFQALVIALYCLGAALSGLLMMRAPIWAGCLPAVAVLFVMGRRSDDATPGKEAPPSP